MENQNQVWHWERGIWTFIEIVQWAFVFHKLGQENDSEFLEIICDPEKVRQKADEYGMTLRAIVDEMLRIGQDGKAMFAAIDEVKRRETEGKTEE